MAPKISLVAGTCGMILASILINSCSASIPNPSEADFLTRPEELSRYSLDELREGRKTYVVSCGSCHRLYSPRERTAHEWLKAYEEMKPRIRLETADEVRMLAYLRAYAKSSPDESPSH